MTGANGFVGSHLVPALAAAGHKVRCMIQPGTDDGIIAPAAAEVLVADLRDHGGVRVAVREMDAIVHLAAVVSDYGRMDRYHSTNVEGTRDLLDAATDAGVRRFLFMSSLAVHEVSGFADGNEDTPVDVRSFPYGLAKRLGEEMSLAAHRAGLIECVIIRPGFFPFGPRDRYNFSAMADKIRTGKLPLVAGGRSVLCTAYVENLVHGMRLALESARAAGRVYVLADGVRVTWSELLTRIAVAIGAPPPRLNLPAPLALGLAIAWEAVATALRPGSDPVLTGYRAKVASRDLYFGIERARRELGYEPLVSLDEGLRRTARWYLSPSSSP